MADSILGGDTVLEELAERVTQARKSGSDQELFEAQETLREYMNEQRARLGRRHNEPVDLHLGGLRVDE